MSKINYSFDKSVIGLISSYCSNGRDTVNLVQTAASVANLENRRLVSLEDVEEVIGFGHYVKNLNKKVNKEKKIGVVNGLAVYGSIGAVIEVEAACARAAEKLKGAVKVTGIISEEEISNGHTKMKRRGTAMASVDNVITVLSRYIKNIKDYDIHINFPGGVPIDGPSAGIAIFAAVYSALTEREVSTTIAMTGEISIKGKINPVGGVAAKIEGAVEAGINKIFIPADNYQNNFSHFPAEIICVSTVRELLDKFFDERSENEEIMFNQNSAANILTAESV